MADVSKVNVNSTDYNIKDSNAMHKGVDRVTAGQSIIAPIGTASTADGFSVNASGDYSHASGFRTIASSDIQHVIGKYNEEDANGIYAFIVGGGRLDFDRKNIFTIDWNGDVNAGRSNGLTNDTKLPTGADVVSYLNSNFTNWTAITSSSHTVSGYYLKIGKLVIATGTYKCANATSETIYTNLPIPIRQVAIPARDTGNGNLHTFWFSDSAPSHFGTSGHLGTMTVDHNSAFSIAYLTN